jgi:hypothetical protein
MKQHKSNQASFRLQKVSRYAATALFHEVTNTINNAAVWFITQQTIQNLPFHFTTLQHLRLLLQFFKNRAFLTVPSVVGHQMLPQEQRKYIKEVGASFSAINLNTEVTS